MNKRLAFLIIMAVMILIIPTVVSANENDTVVGDSNPKDSADLEITTDEKQMTVNYTDEFAIWVTINNKGPETAENVEVQTSIPSNLTLYQALASEGSFNEQTGIWKIDNLKPDQNESMLIVLESKKIGKSTVDFNVESSSKDANPSNNRLTVDVNAVNPYELTTASLWIWSTVTQIKNRPGQEIKFNITVKNDYSKAAENVIVTTIMPKGLVINFNPSKGSFNKKTGIWKIGDINAYETASAEISTKSNNIGKYFFYFELKSDTKLSPWTEKYGKYCGVDVLTSLRKDNYTSSSGDKRLGEQRSFYSPSAYSDYRQVTSSSNHTVEAKMDEKPTGNPIIPALLSLTLIAIRFKK